MRNNHNPMSEPARPPRTLPKALRASLAALPLIPIVIAIFLSGGSGASAQQTTGALFQPVAPPKATPTNLLIPPGRGALVALLEKPTDMRASPGGRVFAHLGLRTEFGSPEGFWVARLSGAWLGVISPQAGNNRLGWIPAADASLGRVNWELKVSLHERRLTVLENGRAVERYTIAIGAPDAPTPTGSFAVTDRLNTGDPSGPYGCCILALSALAPHAIQGWSGGDRIAIHSTPETWTIGEAVSHGCMRLTLAEGRWLLGHIPIGTPTIISS
jgi:hypothetical protein